MTDDETRPDLAYGPLAAALAKAQASFPAIPRDKEVEVKTRTGGSYKFKYAPLDSILSAVRTPLAENGLAIAQLLDGHDLVTMLLHDSGAVLTGRYPLPQAGDNIQALGSAITYLRRYSIQAVLGIATEEDDDGNRAAGNTARDTRQHPGLVDDIGVPYGPPDRPPLVRETHQDGLVGKFATAGNQDANLRETPTGFVLPFRVKEGNRAGQIVLAHDAVAEALFAIREAVIGQTVTVWGTYEDLENAKSDGTVIGYKVLHLSKIKTPDVIIPPESDTVTTPMFPDDDLSDVPGYS